MNLKAKECHKVKTTYLCTFQVIGHGLISQILIIVVKINDKQELKY